ncbi:MAG: RNA polymerase sigma factor [Myxococcota bacterium]
MPATEAEIRDLYGRYAHVLHYRARAILGSDEDAADAVQETFARVLRHWDDFQGQASPLTWMYQISTNYCLNRLRDRKGHARKHEERRDRIVGDGFTPAHDGAGLDDATVRALLEDADDETRRIVLHLFFDDMTREEAAARVGVSVPTLRKRLEAFFKRARRTLGVALPAAVLLLTLLVRELA